MDFIVKDTYKDMYIGSIDCYDGNVEYTHDPKYARIFSGQTWYDEWNTPRYELIDLEKIL